MNVFKKEGADWVFVASSSANDNRLYVELDVEKPGAYIISISFPIKSPDLINTNYAKFKAKHEENFTKTFLENKNLAKVCFMLGVYSRDRNPSINKYQPNLDFSLLFLKEPLIRLSQKNEAKHFFKEENEPESWRSMYFPQNEGGTGYLVYYNLSKGYIYENITFNKFVNLNITSMINETKNLSLDMDDDLEMKTLDEVEKENFLVNQNLLNSRVSLLSNTDPKKPISDDNPMEIQIIIKPKEFGLLIFEKTEETSGFDCSSKLQFIYPVRQVLREAAFPGRKHRLKFNDRLVDITESIIEHTNGVTIKYSNDTKTMKAGVFMKFTKLENLKLKPRLHYDMNGNILALEKKSEVLTEEEAIEVQKSMEELSRRETDEMRKKAQAQGEKFQEEVPLTEVTDTKTEVMILCGPSETAILELEKLDKYEEFSYLCDMDYKINYCRAKNY